jgi:hypothetical protein
METRETRVLTAKLGGHLVTVTEAFRFPRRLAVLRFKKGNIGIVPTIALQKKELEVNVEGLVTMRKPKGTFLEQAEILICDTSQALGLCPIEIISIDRKTEIRERNCSDGDWQLLSDFFADHLDEDPIVFDGLKTKIILEWTYNLDFNITNRGIEFAADSVIYTEPGGFDRPHQIMHVDLYDKLHDLCTNLRIRFERSPIKVSPVCYFNGHDKTASIFMNWETTGEVELLEIKSKIIKAMLKTEFIFSNETLTLYGLNRFSTIAKRLPYDGSIEVLGDYLCYSGGSIVSHHQILEDLECQSDDIAAPLEYLLSHEIIEKCSSGNDRSCYYYRTL